MESYFLDSVLLLNQRGSKGMNECSCEFRQGGTVPLKGRRVIAGYFTTHTNAYRHIYDQPYHDLTFLRPLLIIYFNFQIEAILKVGQHPHSLRLNVSTLLPSTSKTTRC